MFTSYSIVLLLIVRLLLDAVVAAHELIYTSGCIHQFRFTSVELVRPPINLKLHTRISFTFEFNSVFSSTS